MNKPPCEECGKEIYAITNLHYVIGAEHPVLLHAVCYERLKQIEERWSDSFNEK